MQDALLDLSARLEVIQNDLRALATLPSFMRERNNPITLAEASQLTNRLGTMVRFWLARPTEERRQPHDRRRADRRQTPDDENGAVA